VTRGFGGLIGWIDCLGLAAGSLKRLPFERGSFTETAICCGSILKLTSRQESFVMCTPCGQQKPGISTPGARRRRDRDSQEGIPSVAMCRNRTGQRSALSLPTRPERYCLLENTNRLLIGSCATKRRPRTNERPCFLICRRAAGNLADAVDEKLDEVWRHGRRHETSYRLRPHAA
jgi:hypothetical protein